MIFWELLFRCETYEVCDALQRAYDEFGSVQGLAIHLGVSRIALVRKMRVCGTKMHKRGGRNFRFSREILPDKWYDLTPDALAGLTGYTRNYAYKLLRAERVRLGLVPERSGQCKSEKATNSLADLSSDAADSSSESTSKKETADE